ncbi:MAG: hypothetical protein AAFQ91_31725 [Cyanobacteria bacterium J06621_15]
MHKQIDFRWRYQPCKPIDISENKQSVTITKFQTAIANLQR